MIPPPFFGESYTYLLFFHPINPPYYKRKR